MNKSQVFLNFMLMAGDEMIRLHERCCGAIEDEICERHDATIGELEAEFRQHVGWNEDDAVVETAWQQLELAMQDMFREMVLASFVVGLQYGAGLIREDLVEVPFSLVEM